MKLVRLHGSNALTLVALVLVLALGAAAQAGAPATGSQGATEKKQEDKSKLRSPDVIFVPTQEVVVDEMLKMAGVGKNDIVYDLGCGDGRLVITAAKKYGARGVGIDIDPERIKESRANAKKAGVTKLVEFRNADLFESDFSEATVVTLYLLSSLNEKLKPVLLKQLKPGTRIVSHDFAMGDWKPEQQKSVKATDREHTVYLWTVPEDKSTVPVSTPTSD